MLATTDPYEIAAPNITSVGQVGYTIDGHTYELQINGDPLFTMHGIYWHVQGANIYWPLALCFLAAGESMGHASVYYRENTSAPGAGNVSVFARNPISYRRQTPARTILGISHWHCGIHEGRIDTDSFDDTHYDYFIGDFVPDMLCSTYFISESTVTIIKRLLEQSGRSYLYINKLSQLAIDYIPAMPTAYDWEITESDVIRWKRHEKISDRTIPGTVKYGWFGRHINTAEPGCGVWTKDLSAAVEHPRLDKEYQALYLGYDEDDYGTYEHMNEYGLLEVEVGAIGFALEIGDMVKPYNPIWGLNAGITDDIFLILDITLQPNTNTVNLIMIRHEDWGTPP